MHRALLLKELREVAGIGAVGLALLLVFVSGLVGLRVFTWLPLVPHNDYSIPFVSSGFLEYFTFTSVFLVIALGFRQSVWEDLRGTYVFLLHRPIRCGVVIALKLLAGIGVYLFCAGVPLLLYAWWAATPGHHASPFEWSMTDPAWRCWLTMPLLYMSAFLSGIRPARWLGTRLLPLVATGAVVFPLQFLPWWWACGLGVLLVLYLAMLIVIFFVVRTRDF